MDKMTRRRLASFEEGAKKAEKLKVSAASLLKQADEIEINQKAAFESIVLKAIYAAGIEKLPLRRVIEVLASLAPKPKSELVAADDVVPACETFNADVGVKEIDLCVRISRNAAKFALLDRHLSWQGKNGYWRGKVSISVLEEFKANFREFQLEYLRYSPPDLDEVSSNAEAGTDDSSAGEPAGQAETGEKTVYAVSSPATEAVAVVIHGIDEPGITITAGTAENVVEASRLLAITMPLRGSPSGLPRRGSPTVAYALPSPGARTVALGADDNRGDRNTAPGSLVPSE